MGKTVNTDLAGCVIERGNKMNTSKKYKITYEHRGSEKEVVIEATSKYDAKQRFYRMHPEYRIVRVEVEE